MQYRNRMDHLPLGAMLDHVYRGNGLLSELSASPETTVSNFDLALNCHGLPMHCDFSTPVTRTQETFDRKRIWGSVALCL